MATRVVTTDGIGVDLSDFAKFTKALRKFQPELAKSLAVKLRSAGNIVADEARVLGADASESIPSSVKVRVSGLTVSVVAGGNGIPLAGLMELGNKDNRNGSATTFRHPAGNMAPAGTWINGSWRGTWVDQPMHPFLRPALARTSEKAQAAILEALDDTLSLIAQEGSSGG